MKLYFSHPQNRSRFQKTINFIFNWNFLLILIFTWILALKIPRIFSNWQSEGQKLLEIAVSVKKNGLPPPVDRILPDSNQILIYWATWCGPCKIELERFQSAVNEGSLPPNNVWALNIGESSELVERFMLKQKYNLQWAIIQEPSNSYSSIKIEVTPTIVHWKKGGEIKWISSGVNPFTIWKSKSFLNPY